MKIVVRRARRGLLKRNQWIIVVYAANGEVLLTSETYNNRGDAIHTANEVARCRPSVHPED